MAQQTIGCNRGRTGGIMPMRYPRLFAIVAVWAIAVTGCGVSASSASLQEDYRRVFTAGRTRAALKPESLKRETRDGKVIERVAFESEPGERVVAVVVKPETATGRLPAIVVQHWLGGSKDEFLLQALLWQFATRGYLAVAIDGRYRGERANGRSLQAAMTDALRTGKGHPWLIDTVYDVLRTVDYLETREDVDRERIGMTGISEGGLETWMAAAADPRIRVAARVVGVTRFRDLATGVSTSAGEARVNLFRPVLEAFAKQEGSEKIDEALLRKAWDRLLPGFSDRFDADRIVPLIAPRPLLILSHEKDELIPLAGAEAVYAAGRERYRSLNAEDRLRLRVAPGLSHSGQDMTEVAALFEWFDRWLKPAAAKS
jgi:poly(3-hydroxybutyrate) depolymerase